MLLSMTGYGESRVETDQLVVTVEMRSVNNRHLKLSLRTPDGYASLEPRIESMIRARLQRGSLYVVLRVHRKTSDKEVCINRDVLISYHNQLQQIIAETSEPVTVDIHQLLRLPGVIDDSSLGELASTQTENDWPVIEKAFAQAIESMLQMRAEEGRSMRDDLLSNLAALRSRLETIEKVAPQVADDFRQKITERVTRALSEHDIKLEQSDIIREVAIFTDRSDISEEIVRFKSHLDQFDTIMSADESQGRKLDFLIQEMNREVNTIGSKANHVEITQAVVDLKSGIERMREMVQNIE